MEAANSFETLVTVYQSTRRQAADDLSLHYHSCDIFKSRKMNLHGVLNLKSLFSKHLTSAHWISSHRLSLGCPNLIRRSSRKLDISIPGLSVYILT